MAPSGTSKRPKSQKEIMLKLIQNKQVRRGTKSTQIISEEVWSEYTGNEQKLATHSKSERQRYTPFQEKKK